MSADLLSIGLREERCRRLESRLRPLRDGYNKSSVPEVDTWLFDAPFFGFTPMEAVGMDPQQRQLLETVYEALEAAGLTLEGLGGSLTSMHIGLEL
jgi:acyl transferase domain-containing protein